MIRKLKRKFIFTTMISLTIVLTVIMSVVNILNYTNIASDADAMLKILSQNHGEFFKNENGNKSEHIDGENKNIFSGETPYKTRFFSVIFDSDGTISQTNIKSVKSVSETQAKEYAKEVLDSGKNDGYFDDYRYLVSDYNNGKMVIFVNCETQLNYSRSFLIASIVISLLGLIFVFIFVLFFSNRAVKPLAESYEKQKRFITDSGHELKTPLTIISADIEIVEMNNGESEWTQDIKEQIQYLAKLVKDLTALAKMDESKANIIKAQFNISDAVSESVQQFRYIIANSDKKLDLNIDDNITYFGNEELIRRLISILTDNAIKYSKKWIAVSVFKKKGKINIEFENDTIDPITKDVSMFFERFYRTDESRARESSGFGIGLSLAKSIVDLHGGKISVTQKENNLIKFSIIL